MGTVQRIVSCPSILVSELQELYVIRSYASALAQSPHVYIFTRITTILNSTIPITSSQSPYINLIPHSHFPFPSSFLFITHQIYQVDSYFESFFRNYQVHRYFEWSFVRHIENSLPSQSLLWVFLRNLPSRWILWVAFSLCYTPLLYTFAIFFLVKWSFFATNYVPDLKRKSLFFSLSRQSNLLWK